MPSRSIANILYDSKTRQYILGTENGQEERPKRHHLSALRATDVRRRSQSKTRPPLRDVFLFGPAYEMDFQDQQESDNLITLVTTQNSVEERSAIFGDLTSIQFLDTRDFS